MSDQLLARNICYLCGFYPSIAALCRRLDINRQQFNKYLSGQVRPSRHNMRRLCDFFGVTESEMLLEHDQFVEIVSARHRPQGPDELVHPLAHIEALYRESQALDRYTGYYFRYFYSFGHPGWIVKSFASLFEHHGRYYWKNMEPWRRARAGSATKISKYTGAAFFLADRIFIVEYESMLRNAITQVMLYPSYHTRITHLCGVQTGAPQVRGRKPGASRVLLEFLGKSANPRAAIRSCDLFPEDDPAIAPAIRELISNRVPEGAYVLEGEEI